MGVLTIDPVFDRSRLEPLPTDRTPPWLHLLKGDPPLAFLVDGSRLFRVDPSTFAELESGSPSAEQALRELLAAAPGPNLSVTADSEPSALSLNIAQSCNLGCTYCYADEGRFGGAPRLMPEAIATHGVDRLLAGANGRRVTIGFIGGEPFVNRKVLHATVRYAAERARSMAVQVGFSVTTNGTLLDASDLDLLRQHAFAVTVSLDGGPQMHDAHRRTRRGAPSFDAVSRGIAPLLADPGQARVAARATVARTDLRISERVRDLVDMGFKDVGVSPLRTSPNPELALRDDDWSVFLAEMIRAAEDDLVRARTAGQFHFSNLANAVREIHRGSCRPLPCGAAAGYVSMSAEGQVFTCHRTIDDPRFALGGEWPSRAARARFLMSRHVDAQEPCRTCWARYLCGGGCHAEVLSAGRHGCDFIRGWLEYCLKLYDRLLDECPALLSVGNGAVV